MKAPKKAYVGAAVIFERVADDGWPEDAGLWPIDGRARVRSMATRAPKESDGLLSRSSLEP
jgi:hypothetical protein